MPFAVDVNARNPSAGKVTHREPGSRGPVPMTILVLVAAVGSPTTLPHASSCATPASLFGRRATSVRRRGSSRFWAFCSWLFPIRKKLRRAAWLGPCRCGSTSQIGVGLVLPLVGAIHSSFASGRDRPRHIAMLIVCASGVVGGISTCASRAANARRARLGEVTAQQRALLGEIADASGLSILDVQ
jgi:hypothetical protein